MIGVNSHHIIILTNATYAASSSSFLNLFGALPEAAAIIKIYNNATPAICSAMNALY